MVRVLVTIAVLSESIGLSSAILLNSDSLAYTVGVRGIQLGMFAALIAYVKRRGCDVEAAFDLGVEVGHRRARRLHAPTIVRLDDRRPTFGAQTVRADPARGAS